MRVIVSVSDKPGTGNPLEAAFDRFMISEGPTGFDDPNPIVDFMMWPNPASNYVEISITDRSMTGILSVLLYDITGRVILQSAHDAGGKITLNTTGLNKGVYFVTIQNQDKTFNAQKLIKY